MGAWLRVNGESIYGTTASPLPPQSWGRTTVKGAKLYLHVFNWPAGDKLPLMGLTNKVLISQADSANNLWSPSLQRRLAPEPLILIEIEQNSDSSRRDILTTTAMNQSFYRLDHDRA